MDRFILEVVNSHMVGLQEKARMGRELLREAEAMFGGLDQQLQSILEQRIGKLRKVLNKWSGFLTSSLEDELVRYRRAYEYLRQKPDPTTSDLAEIEKLQIRMENLRRRISGEKPKSLGVQPGPRPPELEEAVRFRQQMEARAITEPQALRDAISEAQQEIDKLETSRKGLDASSHQLWGRQIQDVEREIGKLMQKWNAQLSYLNLQETEARDYQWHKDKTGEERRVYIEAKRIAEIKGGEQVDALKMLREAKSEIETAFSYCEMITSKALVQLMPEAMPMDKVAIVVNKSQAILDGVRDRVPEADVREMTRTIDALRRYEAEMNRALIKLGYDKSVESYEEGKKSEGLSYFRANLPAWVKDILPARDVSGLEDLATKGLSGAREAISRAIILAAKRNPERVKALLGK